jgi:hypothetical protein
MMCQLVSEELRVSPIVRPGSYLRVLEFNHVASWNMRRVPSTRTLLSFDREEALRACQQREHEVARNHAGLPKAHYHAVVSSRLVSPFYAHTMLRLAEYCMSEKRRRERSSSRDAPCVPRARAICRASHDICTSGSKANTASIAPACGRRHRTIPHTQSSPRSLAAELKLKGGPWQSAWGKGANERASTFGEGYNGWTIRGPTSFLCGIRVLECSGPGAC